MKWYSSSRISPAVAPAPSNKPPKNNKQAKHQRNNHNTNNAANNNQKRKGITMEDLKKQTALRLAKEGGHAVAASAAVSVKRTTTTTTMSTDESLSHPINNSTSTEMGSNAKLPHGLTVQELKEMTKARLQAEQASFETKPTNSSLEMINSMDSFAEVSFGRSASFPKAPPLQNPSPHAVVSQAQAAPMEYNRQRAVTLSPRLIYEDRPFLDATLPPINRNRTESAASLPPFFDYDSDSETDAYFCGQDLSEDLASILKLSGASEGNA